MPQMRVACFGKKPRATEVNGEHAVPVLKGKVTDGARASDSGIRYQCIQAAKFGYRIFNQPTWHIGIPEVARQCDGGTSH